MTWFIIIKKLKLMRKKRGGERERERVPEKVEINFRVEKFLTKVDEILNSCSIKINF